MNFDFWHRQEPTKSLYPDIEWNRPERRNQAGRLGIIGGNKLGFAGVAEAYSVALQTGAGSVRVLLPDALRRTIPSAITDTVFGPSTMVGSLASDASNDMLALGAWATMITLIGDAGRNSETAIVYEKFLQAYTGPLTITRDAFDLVKNSPRLLADRPQTTAIISFAQLQRFMRDLYYPKMITFSMQLLQLVETLHKFTITYPITVITLHNDQIIVAHGGEVVTQAWTEPLKIWRGTTAARASVYWMWNPSQPLEAVAASLTTTS